jgi:hypothetical protein
MTILRVCGTKRAVRKERYELGRGTKGAVRKERYEKSGTKGAVRNVPVPHVRESLAKLNLVELFMTQLNGFQCKKRRLIRVNK